MIDWFVMFIDSARTLAVGFISFVLGMWYFNKYLLPKMYVKMGSSLFKQISIDPEFQPMIQKLKRIISELEPLTAQVKQIDIEKVIADVKPIIEALKKIKPEDIEALINAVKSFSGTMKETPEIPPPPPNS